jgi:hypothetical protein
MACGETVVAVTTTTVRLSRLGFAAPLPRPRAAQAENRANPIQRRPRDLAATLIIGQHTSQ